MWLKGVGTTPPKFDNKFSRTLNLSDLPIARTKPRFSWICFTNSTIQFYQRFLEPPILQTNFSFLWRLEKDSIADHCKPRCKQIYERVTYEDRVRWYDLSLQHKIKHAATRTVSSRTSLHFAYEIISGPKKYAWKRKIIQVMPHAVNNNRGIQIHSHEENKTSTVL